MKIKIICLAALLAIFTSCQKSELNPNSGSKKDLSPTVERISSASDFEEQQQIFNLMSPCERYDLWKSHLDRARAQFVEKGSPQKVALIDQLYPYLSCSTFEENSATKDILLNYVMPTWIENAKSVFEPMELYDITTDPTEDNVGSRLAPPEIGTGPGDGPPNCWCNVGTSGFSCTTMQIVLGIPPRWELKTGICYKKPDDCSGTRSGCGFLWLSACSGNACQFT